MPRTRAAKGKGHGKSGAAGVFDLHAHRLGRHDVAIVGPNGEPTPIVITLCSRKSPEYRARLFALERDGLVPAADGADAFAVSEAYLLTVAIGVTVDWRGVVVDGVTLPCTPATARDLYTSEGLGWLFEQVVNAHLARERFFGTPGNS